MILQPTPLTAADLQTPFDANWYATKDVVCKDATPPSRQRCK